MGELFNFKKKEIAIEDMRGKGDVPLRQESRGPV